MSKHLGFSPFSRFCKKLNAKKLEVKSKRNNSPLWTWSLCTVHTNFSRNQDFKSMHEELYILGLYMWSSWYHPNRSAEDSADGMWHVLERSHSFAAQEVSTVSVLFPSIPKPIYSSLSTQFPILSAEMEHVLFSNYLWTFLQYAFLFFMYLKQSSLLVKGKHQPCPHVMTFPSSLTCHRRTDPILIF